MKWWLVVAAAIGGCGDTPTCDPNAPNTICTIAGSTANEGYSGDEGPATDAIMYIPMDSVVAPTGDVWFIDFNNYVIRSIDSTGTIHRMIGRPGELGDSPVSDGLASIAALDSANNHTPSMFSYGGELYLAAWHESRIKRVSFADMTMEVFAGQGVRTHYDGDGGPAINASVDLPSGVAVDPAGNIVIMDQANQVVRMVDQSGQIHTIAGHCVIDADVPCNGATPVGCPGSEKLTCGDPAVECVNACTPGFGGDGGPALDARLAEPYGQAADPSGRIIYDHAGNLLIADTGNNRIRKVDPAGTITTIAGVGHAGFAGDGGPATQAELNHPVDLAVADDDTVYFTDVDNSCVRKIDVSGTITTVAGMCNPDPSARGFAGDGGPPLRAKLDRPYGIDLEGSKLYISDSYNNRLRVVNLP